MDSEFAIHAEWAGSNEPVPEVNLTGCALSITANGNALTRAYSEWSKSVSASVYVSAYPLALWLASSWWRLRFESSKSTGVWRPSSDWQMSHDLAAAGFGFVWPQIRFDCDGEQMIVKCRRSPETTVEPIKYLTEVSAPIAVSSFENSVDQFIAVVLERLTSGNIRGSDLAEVWHTVKEERSDHGLTNQRMLEAKLGFDPGEAPAPLMARLADLGSAAGKSAVCEIAAGVAGERAAEDLEAVSHLAKEPGIQAQMELPPQREVPLRGREPWKAGHELAHTLRRELGLNGHKVETDHLLGLLGITRRDNLPLDSHPAPMGLAVQTGKGRAWQLHFRQKKMDNQRFEAARFIGDYILSNRDEHWLAISDATTARQKAQRAFAAEFLCPIKELAGMVAEGRSSDVIDDAADRFGVSPRLVESHLVNHNLIDRDQLTWD